MDVLELKDFKAYVDYNGQQVLHKHQFGEDGFEIRFIEGEFKTYCCNDSNDWLENTFNNLDDAIADVDRMYRTYT